MKNSEALGANEIVELIFTYLSEVSSLSESGDVIFVLANMGRSLTSADRCSIWLVSDDEKTIWTQVSHGMEAVELDIESGIVGSAIVSGDRIIIDDVYEDERFNKEVDESTGYRTKSMMVIPMFNKSGETIGALQVINKKSEDGKFDKRDLERLSLASTYAAETLISAQLSKEISETEKEIILTMGSIGESRSEETGNHVKRVAEYSKILALAYGMSEEEAELLKQASPMHDIGKVAIPDAILNKPDSFTAKEREVMDTHAMLGYKMTKNSDKPLFKAASIVAHEHHEKWDGTGYPRGLSGEDIDIFGRITAIADVFDALGSDRVYKTAWDDEKIFDFFRLQKAKHFDPKLVDLFFENLDEILSVRESLQDESVEIDSAQGNYEDGIKILGAYGTKSKGFATTSFFLNSKNVIDAGNLLEGLEERSLEIENIWLTHSHLDHIVDIAYILDNYFSQRTKTLNVIGLPQTIKTIKENFLNDSIWPDFSLINMNNSQEVALKYTEIELSKEYEIGDGESLKAFQTDHTVDSCGYIYKKADKAILITADTLSLESMIDELEKDSKIKTIIVECSFPSRMKELAIESKHLTPVLLFEQLNRVDPERIKLYINHIKPSFYDEIMNEIAKLSGKWEPVILNDGDFVNF
ncbi:MAG: HD domain-containing protein [Campylobacterota bacterium]|nr:HD domain-containing protein [Campylobacterota bacterium]